MQVRIRETAWQSAPSDSKEMVSEECCGFHSPKGLFSLNMSSPPLKVNQPTERSSVAIARSELYGLQNVLLQSVVI